MINIILINLEHSHEIAIDYYRNGIKPKCSTDISESLSYGYGRLDDNGFWEYPLYFK